MVTAKYLSEQAEWVVQPCEKCGLADLLDAPSDLMQACCPNSPEVIECSRQCVVLVEACRWWYEKAANRTRCLLLNEGKGGGRCRSSCPTSRSSRRPKSVGAASSALSLRDAIA